MYMEMICNSHQHLKPKPAFCFISDGMPEAGGGGAAAEVADGDATGADGATPEASDDDDGGDGDGDPDRRPLPNARRKAAPLPAPSVQPATTATLATRPLLKLPEVLAALPVSRSSWYSGMRSGLYPQPVKLGAKSVAWKRCDIDRLIESLAYSN
ncbi:MAG: AlpA family phage regulatory protein [Hydrogenophaga sp.]|uniref:helix-turn-helix transcriptional regulator n=1 Tax=Hydrogenophaga sp. TaxID=1904254 RepID=UPI002728FCCF|nr:AlpA family phage regulatory protein [Hydrogenophaga sp.]MDO9148074.1 AlpA family phage regulatory protein [Hydrogenophaga sp.]MDO9603698.1 AlpA family phage regulatory protein [Hydrogenophaga sp.]